ncbi:hypothetical protein MRX96_034504 [Rhipicephalus microplus]
MDLHAAFGPGRIGTAVQRFTGSTTNAGISVWPVWDQNIVVVGVKTESLASKLIGDITLTIGDRQVPFQGHLKSAGGTCKGVVTVADNETSESLRRKLEWIDGEISYVRKLRTSNVAVMIFKGRRVPRFIHYCSENVPVRYYEKTVPACYRCGTVGHRPDACPDPDNQCSSTGGTDGKPALIVESERWDETSGWRRTIHCDRVISVQENSTGEPFLEHRGSFLLEGRLGRVPFRPDGGDCGRNHEAGILVRRDREPAAVGWFGHERSVLQGAPAHAQVRAIEESSSQASSLGREVYAMNMAQHTAARSK